MLPNAKAKLLRQLQSRHGRKKAAVFLAEGLRCCAEALTRRPAWVDFVVLADHAGAEAEALVALTDCPVHRVSAAVFGEFAQTEQPQGVLVVLKRPDETPPPACLDPFVLVLDRVQTPGNLGSILRTAAAAGLRQIAYTRGTVDPFGAKCVRAGMGAQMVLDFAAFEDLDAVRRHYAPLGYERLWLTVVEGGASCFAPDFELKGSLLVMGNEAHGSAPVAGADRVTIPMTAGVESLNVAQAATILIYQYVARHGLA